MSQKVNNLGEALTVLVQVAELAQAKGILSFEDAVITKQAIDFIAELSKQVANAEQSEQEVDGPIGEATPTKSRSKRKTEAE
jgi:hypothetical protein